MSPRRTYTAIGATPESARAQIAALGPSSPTASAPVIRDFLRWNGTAWVPSPLTSPAPATGNFLRWNGTDWVPSATGPSATSVIVWGNSGVMNTTTTRYLDPWMEQRNAPTSPVQWVVPRSGLFQWMWVYHNGPAGNGNPIVYTLEVNGAPTPLAVSIASTESSASNLVDTVIVAAGDRVSVVVTKAASIGSSPNDILVGMELA